MPVESRLRSALAEQAAEVRVDTEQPLEVSYVGAVSGG